MTEQEIKAQLEAIAIEPNFLLHSYKLVDCWSSAGIGTEVIEPILCFMENHPDIDFGLPGPMVQLIERYYLKGGTEREQYEKGLIDSFRRKPTEYTLLMLNRILNVTDDQEQRRRLLAIVADARRDSSASEDMLESIDDVLKRQSSK